MIHYSLSEIEIQNLNELHRVKTCNICSQFKKENSKCKQRNIIVNHNNIQCNENSDYMLKNLGVK